MLLIEKCRRFFHIRKIDTQKFVYIETLILHTWPYNVQMHTCTVHVCMHVTHMTHSHVYKQLYVYPCIHMCRPQTWFSFCTKNTLPPTKYRNPKTDKELIVTLISVTICSLIFFICNLLDHLWSGGFKHVKKSCGVKHICQYMQ